MADKQAAKGAWVKAFSVGPEESPRPQPKSSSQQHREVVQPDPLAFRGHRNHLALQQTSSAE